MSEFEDAKAPWNYFVNDSGYSNVLRDRLRDHVEMDSAIALGTYLNERVRGDISMVDFGGGPGHYYPAIKRLYSSGTIDYLSVDIDHANIRFGTEYFADDPHARFAVGSILDPASFLLDRDGVVSANTLPHVPAIAPLLRAIAAAPSVNFFLFRMLIGNECVEIRKHLKADQFNKLFEDNYQHNNIYSLAYLAATLGTGWELEVMPDRVDRERLAQHNVPMQQQDAFYGNRVSRAVGDMTFKGDIYMPWKFVFGRRTGS